jgi:hypothetical protein
MAVRPISLAVGRCAEPGFYEPAPGDKPTHPVTSFISGRVLQTLHDAASVEFTVAARSPEARAIDGLGSDVWVYRDGVKWLRCRILPVTQDWDEDGDSTVQIAAVGYKRLLDWRYFQADLDFEGVNQHQIIRQVIAHTQAQDNGGLGIVTSGSWSPVDLRTRRYQEGDNIGQRLDELSDVIDGPWWDIDADLACVSHNWDELATNTDPLVLGTNARKMRRVPAQFVNVSGAIGSAEQTTPEWRVTPAVTAWEDVRGRWEMFDASHGSVTEQATVVEYAQSNLAHLQNPPAAWTVEIEPARYFGWPNRYDVARQQDGTTLAPV